jgi:protoheme IX farnesyltransferase
MLAAASLIPVSLGMSGTFYLIAISLLDLVFLGYAIALCRNYSDTLARRAFRYSILYLTLLFAALFIDRLF